MFLGKIFCKCQPISNQLPKKETVATRATLGNIGDTIYKGLASNLRWILVRSLYTAYIFPPTYILKHGEETSGKNMDDWICKGLKHFAEKKNRKAS